MPIFNNLHDLKIYLAEKVSESMNDVGKTGRELVRDTMDEVVYSHEPSKYNRTYELRDSISWNKEEMSKYSFQVEIYSDSDKIEPYGPGTGYDYAHYSYFFSDGEDGNEASHYPLDYSEWVAGTVEYGTSGLIFGTGYWTEPRPFMGRSREAMSLYKIHVRALQKSLQKKGIDSAMG